VELPTGFVDARANGFYILTRPVYYKMAVAIAERDPETLLAAAPAGGPMTGRGGWIELDGEGTDRLILKKQRRGGLYRKLRGDIHKDDYSAIGEVHLSETAWKKGVPVGLMAFAMSAPAGEGRLASYRRGYAAAIKIPAARSLMDWVTSDPSPGQRRGVIGATAHVCRRAHDRGFAHADLNLGNILVACSEQGEYTGWMIDLIHSTIGGTLKFKPRLENLMRLYRSVEKWLPADTPRKERQRRRDIAWFLHCYAKGDRAARKRILEGSSRYRTSLMLHRLTWGSAQRRSAGS